MITTLAIIDRLKEINNWSDYRTARELEITPQSINQYRNKGRVMADEVGLKAADLLGLPAELILISLAAERSLNSPAFEVLDSVAQELASKRGTKKALKNWASAAALVVVSYQASMMDFFCAPCVTT